MVVEKLEIMIQLYFNSLKLANLKNNHCGRIESLWMYVQEKQLVLALGLGVWRSEKPLLLKMKSKFNTQFKDKLI